MNQKVKILFSGFNFEKKKKKTVLNNLQSHTINKLELNGFPTSYDFL